MPSSALFIDLAGTLVLRDPSTRRVVAWTGVAGLLHDLAATHQLHLTTGDSEHGAHATLNELDVADLFTGVHANLSGGGKPFGALATALGLEPERCLVIGDNPINDTAGDSDRVVSLILRHETAQVATPRVREVVSAVDDEQGFLRGFTARVNGDGGLGPYDGEAPLDLDALPVSALGDDCRLGWWQKTARSRRAVVMLTA
jgi:hypothetical protein